MKLTFTITKNFKTLFGAAAMFIATSAVAQPMVFNVIADSPDHNYLEAALIQEGLDAVLSDPSAEFTVFAPTDAAFDALAAALGTDITGLLALPNLTDVLTYHVLGSVVPSSAVTNGAIVQPVSFTNTLKLTVTGLGGVFVNQAQVTAVDLNADNGLVHVLDAVLLPFETVVDVAIDNGFNTLTAAVIYAEVMPVYTNPLASYTVFAPTDEAFQDFAAFFGVTVEDLFVVNSVPVVADVLAYHILPSQVLAADITNGLTVQPVSTTNTLKLTVAGSGDVFVNQAQITATDIMSENGVVHVLNSVVLQDETVVDIALDNNFSSLAAAIIKAELMPALTNPFAVYTVFAPTNEAFEELAAALGTDLNGVLDLPFLADVLLYHVVSGQVMSGDLVNGPVTTLNGSDITVDLTNGVMINDAMVTMADLVTENIFAPVKVVHVIDGVLLPPNVGINETNTENISVYPNPAINTVQFNGNDTYEYSIMNVLGQVVSNGTTANQSISVSDLETGMYTIVLNNQDGTLTSKFLKN